MAPRLKVFGWSDGFHSWTVATSSRPKALEAWNVEQDLFKSGLAREIADGPERDAALATPGPVIRTARAIDPGTIKALKPDPEQARRSKAKARANEIQARMDALDTALSEQIRQIRAQRALLDRKIARLESDADIQRAGLLKAFKG